MAMTQSPPPSGYVEIDRDETLWQIGIIFQWSPPINGWYQPHIPMLSIRPGESVGEAYFREYEEAMPNNIFAFTPEGF